MYVFSTIYTQWFLEQTAIGTADEKLSLSLMGSTLSIYRRIPTPSISNNRTVRSARDREGRERAKRSSRIPFRRTAAVTDQGGVLGWPVSWKQVGKKKKRNRIRDVTRDHFRLTVGNPLTRIRLVVAD